MLASEQITRYDHRKADTKPNFANWFRNASNVEETSHDNVRQFRLFDLPRELRNQIYDFIDLDDDSEDPRFARPHIPNSTPFIPASLKNVEGIRIEGLFMMGVVLASRQISSEYQEQVRTKRTLVLSDPITYHHFNPLSRLQFGIVRLCIPAIFNNKNASWSFDDALSTFRTETLPYLRPDFTRLDVKIAICQPKLGNFSTITWQGLSARVQCARDLDDLIQLPKLASVSISLLIGQRFERWCKGEPRTRRYDHAREVATWTPGSGWRDCDLQPPEESTPAPQQSVPGWQGGWAQSQGPVFESSQYAGSASRSMVVTSQHELM